MACITDQLPYRESLSVPIPTSLMPEQTHKMEVSKVALGRPKALAPSGCSSAEQLPLPVCRSPCRAMGCRAPSTAGAANNRHSPKQLHGTQGAHGSGISTMLSPSGRDGDRTGGIAEMAAEQDCAQQPPPCPGSTQSCGHSQPRPGGVRLQNAC